MSRSTQNRSVWRHCSPRVSACYTKPPVKECGWWECHVYYVERWWAVLLCCVTSVIVELDRLSRGSKDRHFDSPEHSEMLRSSAQKAVAFLEDGFDARNSHLRALTAEGTTLDTIAFRSEQFKDLVSSLFSWSLVLKIYYCLTCPVWKFAYVGFSNPTEPDITEKRGPIK